VTIQDGQPALAALGVPGADHAWVNGPIPIPLMAQVAVDGRDIPTYWSFKDACQDKAAGTLTLAFENADPPMTLRSCWRALPGPGPVEHWIEITNNSATPVMLTHQDSLTLSRLTPNGAADLWWVQRGGSNASTQGGTHTDPLTADRDLDLRSNCEDGASPVPWLAVQVGEERGLYVGWEFSGLGRIRATAVDDGKAVALHIGNLPEFKTDIAPGETFLVPPAFVGCYNGNIDDGAYSLHQWFLKHLRPALAEDIPDPILAYNLYLDAGGPKAKEADVLRSAAFCADLGFEAFMPDAMWFPECGDWRWDPARFPQGVTPVEEFVHGKGMKLALWCAWTNGGISEAPGALSVRGPVGHPDWFGGDFKEHWKPGPFYGGNICLGSPEAKAWAIEKTQWLVGNHKLDYLKHDCGPIVNNCNKKDHRHHYGVDASYWATMGYYEVQEKLRAAYPRVILENCSGGGHIKDYGIMRRTHYVVTTDTLSNLPDRQSIYDSTFAMPPLVLQAYTYEREYKVPGDDPGSFLWRSAMMGAWQIDPTNTRIWTDADRDCARRNVQIYKEWIRPMLKDVKVHHILPRPDGVHWDGMFYWSPSLKRGTVYIFRPDSPDATQNVPLKGLNPDSAYWVWSEDGSIAAATRTGADLMEAGIAPTLSDRYTCDLIYVQDAALGKPEGLEAPGAFRLLPAETTSDAFHASAKLSWESAANARSYRVTVSLDERLSAVLTAKTVNGTTCGVPKLAPESTLYYRVQALSWGGTLDADGGPGSFLTPKLADLPGVTFVSDMDWVKSNAGAKNEVHRDTNYGGSEISVAGKVCPKGVWTHAYNNATPADVVIDVAGKPVARFIADAGVEDSGGGGSVQFQVLIDGKRRAESPVMTRGRAHHFDVDITNAKEITLRVLNGGDGYQCDHAAWAGARFLKAGAADVNF
jgi:alpha-galactosidase